MPQDQGKTVEEIKTIIDSLHEFNPMMGHRGCRLAVTYPEIAVMQTKAVIKAAINVKKNHPEWNVEPEIMIPLVGDVKELKYVKDFVVKTADAVIADCRHRSQVPGRYHDRDPAELHSPQTRSQKRQTSSASAPTT